MILNRLLRPGGTMTVIEGTMDRPTSIRQQCGPYGVQCQVELQRLAGGNASIGRQLYPLMVERV